METDFVKKEKKILKFWKEAGIFEKSIKSRAKERNFVFYEGPPTANGKPGIHHLEARAFKDVVCRYKTMQGFKVLRKAGWDTHGLPVELEVEKKLGLKSKKDIEKFGIAKFNKKCKESVWQYKSEWEDLTERIGYWLDMKKPYITYESNYIETVWWVIKQVFEKGLLYQDYKVVPYCPRCGTPLSSHEVAQGYKKVKENSIYVKFTVKGQKNTYFLVWTTTPWTLPANVAIAINPKLVYAKVKIKNEHLIIAKERLSGLKENYKVIKEFKGKDLLGLEYEPLFNFVKPDKPAYRIIDGDFVTTEEGTGLVHIAPAFGEDDMKVGKENDLPILTTVDEQGKFKKEIKPWAGKFVKNADPMIIEDLKKKGLLFKEELYEHDYPFCWRCKTPLLYYAKKSWFIRMTEVKKDLIKNNQKINWTPSHLKQGRFGEWLKGIKDWAVSRERYWGTPLPIWKCDKCKELKVIGSIKELEKLSKRKISNLHRPFIDKVSFKCKKCKGLMKRVPEVFDCWFESGSMPFAQYHYPFENKDLIDKKKQFPADYICEAIDQTRGWFYTLLAISTLLEQGLPYKNVISLGHVLDEKGEKMSKSKGNVVDPWYIVEKYGADASRWYFYTINQPGDSKLFDEKDVEKSLKKFIMTFWNIYAFFETYVPKKQAPSFTSLRSNDSEQSERLQFKVSGSKNVLDKWIVSRLNGLVEKVTQKMDSHDIVFAARDIESFIINDLSLWYIRRSRRRFQKPKTLTEKEDAAKTLWFTLLTLAKLIAPMTPFLAEQIYQGLKTKPMAQSVHLEDWPKADKKLIDKDLEVKMEQAREIVTMALGQRAIAGIKVRQPLALLKIKTKIKIEEELLDLIKNEVNIKKITFDSKIKDRIELDTKITPALKEEGLAREVIRQIQGMRKKAGYKPRHRILVRYSGAVKLNNILAKNKEFILREIGAEEFIPGQRPDQVFDIEREFKLDQDALWLAIRKI